MVLTTLELNAHTNQSEWDTDLNSKTLNLMSTTADTNKTSTANETSCKIVQCEKFSRSKVSAPFFAFSLYLFFCSATSISNNKSRENVKSPKSTKRLDCVETKRSDINFKWNIVQSKMVGHIFSRITNGVTNCKTG